MERWNKPLGSIENLSCETKTEFISGDSLQLNAHVQHMQKSREADEHFLSGILFFYICHWTRRRGWRAGNLPGGVLKKLSFRGNIGCRSGLTDAYTRRLLWSQ